MNLKVILLFIIILLLIVVIPPLIIGEILYSWDRSKYYDDLDGFTSFSLKTLDDVNIQGWYTNNSDKVAIILHGHNDHSKLMNIRYGNRYQKWGYDLVFLDLRNHGRSEIKKPIALGVAASEDVKTILKWVSNQSWEESVLFGTSMGSISSILAINRISEDVVPDKLILDSTFIDYQEVINNNMKKYYVPNPYRSMSLWYLNFRYSGVNFPNILKNIKNISIPILVIHGENDIVAPPNVLDTLESLDKENIQTALIKDAEHSRLFRQSEYWDHISNFLSVSE